MLPQIPRFSCGRQPALQAILAYTGVVFKNINPKDFTEADFRFAQDHLRLVSICYGLLRPLDLIKPYRMEYDVKLPELGEGICIFTGVPVKPNRLLKK